MSFIFHENSFMNNRAVLLEGRCFRYSVYGNNAGAYEQPHDYNILQNVFLSLVDPSS